ncbi:MAG: hypothetical protein JRM80_12135 [Nitrososphaerota archaeon]|nr:hypothetical protein [Nitrososphaerota archaeon]
MNAGKALEIIAINAILLLGLYFVSVDVAARSAYAAREGMSYTFSQSFLVETSSLQGPRGNLQSPLSLSWLQVLLAVLVIIDVLYVYGWVQRKRVAT